MNRKMTRVLTASLGLSLTLSVFAGCGNTEKAAESTTAASTAASTQSAAPSSSQSVKMDTVSVWTNNASQKDQDQSMVAAFNEGAGKEKGIQIEYKIFGGDYNNVLKVALAADEAPHLYKNLDYSYVKAGWAIPLEDLPGAAEWLKRFDGKLIDNVHRFNGKTYGVPYMALTCAVAYNKDLLKKNGFENPPKTWEELRDMAKVITKNGNGKEFGFIEGLKSTGYVAWNGLWQNLSSVGTTEWNGVTGKFEFSKHADFYQILADMRKDGSWFPGVEGLNNDGARAQFAEGNIGFKLSASWDVGVWKDQFPAKMSWGFCRPSMASGENFKYTVRTEAALSASPKAKEIPEKVLEVYKTWTSDEHQIALYEAGKAIPLFPELLAKAKTPDIANWAQIADISGGYNYGSSPVVDVQVEGDTREVAIAKILTLQAPVKETLDDLDKRYNAAFEKAKSSGNFDVNGYMVKNYDGAKK